MAARRGKNQARRNGRNGTRPAWVWVVAGLAIGAVAFLVVPALMKGDGDGFARFGRGWANRTEAVRIRWG